MQTCIYDAETYDDFEGDHKVSLRKGRGGRSKKDLTVIREESKQRQKILRLQMKELFQQLALTMRPALNPNEKTKAILIYAIEHIRDLQNQLDKLLFHSPLHHSHSSGQLPSPASYNSSPQQSPPHNASPADSLSPSEDSDPLSLPALHLFGGDPYLQDDSPGAPFSFDYAENHFETQESSFYPQTQTNQFSGMQTTYIDLSRSAPTMPKEAPRGAPPKSVKIEARPMKSVERKAGDPPAPPPFDPLSAWTQMGDQVSGDQTTYPAYASPTMRQPYFLVPAQHYYTYFHNPQVQAQMRAQAEADAKAQLRSQQPQIEPQQIAPQGEQPTPSQGEEGQRSSKELTSTPPVVHMEASREVKQMEPPKWAQPTSPYTKPRVQAWAQPSGSSLGPALMRPTTPGLHRSQPVVRRSPMQGRALPSIPQKKVVETDVTVTVIDVPRDVQPITVESTKVMVEEPRREDQQEGTERSRNQEELPNDRNSTLSSEPIVMNGHQSEEEDDVYDQEEETLDAIISLDLGESTC